MSYLAFCCCNKPNNLTKELERGESLFQFILSGHSLSSREIKARTEAGSEALNTVEEELLSYCLVVILSQPFDVTQDHLPKVVTALGGLDHSTAINNQNDSLQT